MEKGNCTKTNEEEQCVKSITLIQFRSSNISNDFDIVQCILQLTCSLSNEKDNLYITANDNFSS